MVEKIRDLCRKNGTSLCALERELKIGNGVIARWSKSSPKVENVKAVADYFGVTVDYLLQGGDQVRTE